MYAHSAGSFHNYIPTNGELTDSLSLRASAHTGVAIPRMNGSRCGVQPLPLSKPGEGGPQAGCGWKSATIIDRFVEKIRLNKTYSIHSTAQYIAAFQPPPPTAVGTPSMLVGGKGCSLQQLPFNRGIATTVCGLSRNDIMKPTNSYFQTPCFSFKNPFPSYSYEKERKILPLYAILSP